MSQRPSFVYRDSPHFVCKLRKAIYGLKQAPNAWYHELHYYLLFVGFSNCSANTSLFIYNNESCTIYLLVYVDDIIITCNTDSTNQDFITTLSLQFSIKDLDDLFTISLAFTCYLTNMVSTCHNINTFEIS